MKLSVRAAAVAAAVCASAGSGAGIASATALTPAQTEAVEHAVAQSQVPFAVPLDGAVQPLVGGTTGTAGVSGSLPAAPVVPPSPQSTDGHQILPDPLVPALNTTQVTPGLAASAPLSGVDGNQRSGVLGIALPSAPLKTVGTAVSLGRPLGYRESVTRSADPGAMNLNLDRLDPTVSDPQVQTSPSGWVNLDQGNDHQHLLQDLQDFVATTRACVEYLRH
jgi:hypothetical protein